MGLWSANVVRNEVVPNTYSETWTFSIKEADGTPAGVIVASGNLQYPVLAARGTFPIIGSTNAYYGVQGTVAPAAANSAVANMSNELIFVATLMPMCTPDVAPWNQGPAIAHSVDYTPVTLNSPAEAGEILTMIATDLMAELEDTEWPPNAESMENCPVQVKVGGENSRILYAGMYPGVENTYQINFQVPADVPAGMADVQISTGFIGGSPVAMPVH
jgi:uncharacterized protein (TIGR03437 family)